MFTGIISAIGEVIEVKDGHQERALRIATPYCDVSLGESIAVNGTCLTVAALEQQNIFLFYASTETCRLTNLGALVAGNRVNLERALRLSDRLSGHLVQGHVDGLAQLAEVRSVGESREIKVKLPAPLAEYAVDKGSIALDGISLTVNQITGTEISLMIIPHTWEHTILPTKKVGQYFNVELDMVAKYVRKFVTR